MDPVTMGIAYGLAQFAPKLIGLLTGSGKAEAVAEHAIEIAGVVTGKTDPADALSALRTNQELAIRFREAVMANETELDRMYLADRQDARKRDIEIVKATGGNARANWMITSVLVGLLACLGTLIALSGALPGEVVGIISTIVGILGKCLSDAFQYEFGSSRGSAEKSTAIEQMARGGK